MADVLDEAIRYFRQEAGFCRLLPLLAQKYCSLGRLGGTVFLAKLSHEEATAFMAFFRRPYEAGQGVTISFAEFIQALAKTKFSGADILELLGQFCGTPLVSKAEQAETTAQFQQQFWQELRSKYHEGLCQAWLEAVEQKQSGTRAVHMALEHDAGQFAANAHLLLAALTELPVEYERLSVFARRICGNPHAFDSHTQTGKMLLDALKVLLVRNTRDGKSAVEEENERLYAFGLLRDDVLNFVTCAGLAAAVDAEKTQELTYLRQAWQACSMLNMPLRELLKCHYLYSAQRGDSPVFIVENSGVFSSLLDLFYQQTGYLPPLLCTHGQFKLASWAAMERLAAADCSIWYSGDFDPEGLLMAQKLKERYPDRVHFWHYELSDYSISLSKVKLDSVRLKKLDSVTCPELLVVAGEIRKLQLAGYQEALVELLNKDMQNWIK